MKSLHWILTFVLAGTTAFFSWNYFAIKHDADKWKNIVSLAEKFEGQKLDKIAAEYASYTKDSIKSKILSGGKPFSDIEWAKEYHANFRKLCPPNPPSILIDSPLQNCLSKQVWFEKEMICNMVKFIFDDSTRDGIRIYFSKYSKFDINNPDPQRDDAITMQSGIVAHTNDNRHALIFAVTRDSLGKHVDAFHQHSKQDPKFTVGTDPWDGLYNYTDLCPPSLNCYYGIISPNN